MKVIQEPKMHRTQEDIMLVFPPLLPKRPSNREQCDVSSALQLANNKAKLYPLQYYISPFNVYKLSRSVSQPSTNPFTARISQLYRGLGWY
jgi:hypothetical protein